MISKAQRPVHLNLLKIKLPIAGIMSIIHRATGMYMFILVPYFVYLLDLSLASPEGYAEAAASLQSGIGPIIVFTLMWSVMHHLLAGIRYLLIDIDLGVEKDMARQTALGVTVAGPILGLLLTVILL